MAIRNKSGSDLHNIKGLIISLSDRFLKENIEDAIDYTSHDGDIIIASYPKTGTTWMQYIVWQILSKAEFFPSFEDIMMKFAPYIEMTGKEAVDALVPPRVYKHHIAYNLVQKNPKSKCLYIYRKPEDTCVSYFHFYNSKAPSEVEMKDFFEDYVSGNLSYGRYFEHVQSYFDHKDDENLLLISYEDLQLDSKNQILRIAKFLGKEYYTPLINDDSLMCKIIEQTSFEYMKKNLKMDLTLFEKKDDLQKKPNVINFFRKGVIGDGKTSLSPEQLKKLKSVAHEVLKEKEMLEKWFLSD